MNDFFKKYILKSVLIIVAFFVINILLLFIFASVYVFSSSLLNDEDNISTTEILEDLKGSSQDRVRLREELYDSNSFFFILNDKGEIIDSENLPENLNHPYSNSQIASFSRWYLEDYPVITHLLPDGKIFVLGLPVNSRIKYNSIFTPFGLFWEIFLVPFLLIGNLLIFILIQIYSTKRLENEIVPIIDGIENLANGKKVDLELKGQLRKVREELNQSSTLLQTKEISRIEWINEISHDIRTPLSVISNSAELLSPEDPRAKLILSNVQKIKDLIEQLNLENRLDAGNIPLTKKEVNVNLVLSECITDFLNEKDLGYPVSINFSESFTTARIPLDTNLFTRSIRNLLQNTYLHGGKEATLNVTGRTNEDRIFIEIRDTGRGIDSKELETLLRSDTFGSRRGMGLKFVQKVISAHGGKVIFESNVGEGFTTRIELKI